MANNIDIKTLLTTFDANREDINLKGNNSSMTIVSGVNLNQVYLYSGTRTVVMAEVRIGNYDDMEEQNRGVVEVVEAMIKEFGLEYDEN